MDPAPFLCSFSACSFSFCLSFFITFFTDTSVSRSSFLSFMYKRGGERGNLYCKIMVKPGFKWISNLWMRSMLAQWVIELRGVLMWKQEGTGKRGWLRKKYLSGRKRGGVYQRGGLTLPFFPFIFFCPKFPLFCSSDVNRTLACNYIINSISF